MLLDIDFDFFVKEVVFHDFSYKESKLFMESIWDIRFIQNYALNRDLTKEFIIDEKAINEVLELLKGCKVKVWAISDSHLFTYKFIESNPSILDSILHIDRHSDYCPVEDTIHCGNWLRYVVENIKKIPIFWIPQSKSDLYVDEKTLRGKMKIKNKIFLKSQISNIDCIFLSRSSAWTPPWLDPAYFKFQNGLEKMFGEPLKYEPIPKQRAWDYDKLMTYGLEERKIFEQLRANI